MSLRSRAAAVSCLGAVVRLGVGVEIFLATSIPYREHNLSRANLAQSLLTVPCALTLLPLIFESMVKVCVDKSASSRKFRHVSQQEHDLIRKMHAGGSSIFQIGKVLGRSTDTVAKHLESKDVAMAAGFGRACSQVQRHTFIGSSGCTTTAAGRPASWYTPLQPFASAACLDFACAQVHSPGAVVARQLAGRQAREHHPVCAPHAA